MDSVLPAASSRAACRPAPPRLRRWAWLLILLAFATYGVLLARHVGAYAGGSDSSGYMNHARLLGEGQLHVSPRSIPELATGNWSGWLYCPLGFRLAADGHALVPTYPTGLPLWVLAAAKLVGWERAGNVVIWLHAMAGIVLTYAAGRTFRLTQRSALLAAVMVAGSPLYLFMSVQAMSDMPALVWTTAAILASWRSRQRWPWAFAAGAAFGMAVLIRPTNALAVIPIAFVLGVSWRRWAAFGAGGLPFAIFFALHSHAAYGKYLTTGYDPPDLESQWIVVTLKHYVRWLPLEFTPLVVAFLGLPFLLRRAPRETVVLLTWVLVYAGFYAAYYCTHETWWYLRFLLPAAPALVIGALLVLQSGLGRRVSCRMATVIVCLGLAGAVAFNGYWTKKLAALDAGDSERIYPQSMAWLREHLPANAVVAAMQHTGALYYSTDFTFVRWDNLDAKSFPRLTAALQSSGRPLYAALFPFEIDEQKALSERMPSGRWTKIGAVRDITFWQWSPEPR